MRSPLSSGREKLLVDTVDSTQALAKELIAQNQHVGVIIAADQTAGVGRFGRAWFSEPGKSLNMSLILHDYANHPQAHLVGMTIAVAAAGVLHCQLQWPNDLVIGAKKTGGILTEMVTRPDGKIVPVVGVGINLGQTDFPPEIADRATSLAIADGLVHDPLKVADKILSRLEILPEPLSWAELAPIWMVFDRTPGKRYKLPTGDLAIAMGIGPEGQLACSVDGESQTVLAAEAIFG